MAGPPVVVMSSENGGVNGDPLERLMDSHSLASVSQLPASQIGFPQTPQPPPSSLPGTYASTPEHDALLSELFREGEGQQEQPASPLVPVSQTEMAASKGNGDIGSIVDQALRRLREAAQRIAEVEQSSRRMPRASRLSPMPDISADIQRHSTPLPRLSAAPLSASQAGVAARKEKEGMKTADQTPLAGTLSGKQGEDLGRRIPDLWPWLQEDADPDESDQWSDYEDPLIARQFPNSAEIKRIEEEDLRRAIAEGLVTLPTAPLAAAPLMLRAWNYVVHGRSGGLSSPHRMRRAFTIFIILAIAFLVVDSVLLSVVFIHPHRPVPLLNGPPSLTLSTNVARVGQTVVLHIRNFSADSEVFLTHDIQEAVQLTKGSARVQVGAGGSADVTMLVDDSWGPGYHTIESEGFTTRYTASATLQIIGAGPTRPSHLLISATIDLGSDLQGANTLQPLTLDNSGGGSISWAASSNQPWLLVSPPQGVFSASQTITVAGTRANLKPGDYKGTITFSSNVGSNQLVQVHMSVRPLPANVGAVLEVIPPVLSFTALDGGLNPNNQALVVNNPGTQPLHWSLAGNNPISQASQGLLLNTPTSGSGWLSTSQTSGVVVPHGTELIYVMVNSSNLLPGVYSNVLAFTAGSGAYNSPQSVSISLTVQSRCGLAVSTGIMSFTAVSGHGNPSNRSLVLKPTTSCTSVIGWKAIASANWLIVTPASGQLKDSAVTTVTVNAAILRPGTYVSNISFTAAQNTQTVTVQLQVQPAPPPTAPIMGATPLTLNFNTTQNMADPPGQMVTITNTGRSQLNWHTTVNTLASSWLVAGPTGGTIAPGQTGEVTIGVSTAGLTPNTYVGQVVLIGTDANGVTAAGSPQTISINLLVLPSCTLQQPSLRAVAFSSTQGTTDPGTQPVVLTATGNCAWPLSWQAQVTSPAPWLKLTPASGSLVASGQSTSMTFIASITGLTANTYTTSIKLTATDGSNTSVQGIPQIISVTLNVLPPCSLQVDTANLAFSVAQGQPAPPEQSFSLSESGNCPRPVSWSASPNTSSGNWLVLSQHTGTDSSSVQAGINPQNMMPGTYTGTITVTASGSGGAIVQGSPQTINVVLTVTGYSLSGTALACSDSSCSSTKALPGASLNLVNNTTNQAVSTLADGSGAYSFSNLALGSYTLTVTGSDGTVNYAGTVTLNLSGHQANFSVDAYPK